MQVRGFIFLDDPINVQYLNVRLSADSRQEVGGQLPSNAPDNRETQELSATSLEQVVGQPPVSGPPLVGNWQADIEQCQKEAGKRRDEAFELWLRGPVVNGIRVRRPSSTRRMYRQPVTDEEDGDLDMEATSGPENLDEEGGMDMEPMVHRPQNAGRLVVGKEDN
ncbi:hypothetical protein FALBO_8902 [Fusarium albosuccineum]|uniref:Uncharacterized protein n=1 Tax=Fusarium albosuccineum TaxID=1237068 RepID=A0A8H4P6G4_9HYPO|nr:hypothetical protein FALBO_8902 [Fusarium albosuccineum]